MLTLRTSFHRAALACLAGLGLGLPSQAQTTAPAPWRSATAITSANGSTVYTVATDAAGNTYTAGSFRSPLTLAPGTVLSPQSGNDAYVAKYSPGGALLWVRQVSGPGNERVVKVVLDATGTVYLIGTYEDGVILGSLSQSGAAPATFLAALDAQGQPLWLRQVGGSASDLGRDAAGNLYYCGLFVDNVKFGSLSLSSPGALSAFIVKYDAQGVAQWARQGGSIPLAGSIGAYSPTLVVSPAGNSYLTWTIPAAAGGFGPVPPAPGYGDSDVTVVHYDAQGTAQWQKRYGSAQPDYAGTSTLDGNGHLLTAITFPGSYPATVGNQSLATNSSYYYGALVQLDAATGSLGWVRTLVPTYYTSFLAVAADPAGNSYVAGELAGQAPLGTQTLSSTGYQNDALVVSYTVQGVPRWAQKSGSASAEGARYIAVTAPDELSVAGYFYGEGHFAPFALTGTSPNTASAYVARLGRGLVSTTPPRTLSLGLYPTPTTDQLHLPALSPGTPVQLLDAQGRVAREATVSAAAQVSVRGLPPGLYILRTTTPQGQPVAARVVVQ